jgi:hypothetical protein
MKRFISALVGASLLLAGCTASEAGSGGGTSEPKPFRKIATVRPERVESSLTPAKVATCLDERIDIASLAGMYTGPLDLTEGQVEGSRGLEVSLESVEMLDAKAFSDRLAQGAPKRTRDSDLVNRWLLWSLGYIPLGEKGSSDPPGGGAHFVAGFYDPRSQEIVVRQKGAMDEEYITLAHEIAHAASDQNFGIKQGSLRLIDDENLAYDAVVEGDATLVELRFASQFSKRKLITRGIKRLIGARSQYIEDRAAGTPSGIIDQFVFPYQYGLTFVCSVFKKRGWSGVNRMYDEPPTTTAEVIFPDRYLNGWEPEDPAPLRRVKGWRLYGKGTIGPANLMSMFAAPADVEAKAMSNALGRVAAWNGGEYKVWAKKKKAVEHVMAMSFAEHPKHKGVLCSSLAQWYEEAYPMTEKEMIGDRVVSFSDPGQTGDDEFNRTGILSCQGSKIQLVIAPTRELAESVITL